MAFRFRLQHSHVFPFLTRGIPIKSRALLAVGAVTGIAFLQEPFCGPAGSQADNAFFSLGESCAALADNIHVSTFVGLFTESIFDLDCGKMADEHSFSGSNADAGLPVDGFTGFGKLLVDGLIMNLRSAFLLDKHILTVSILVSKFIQTFT